MHVFDLSQHNAEPADSTFHPQHRLHGHEEEGYGISWNSFNAGHLLSASTDKSICLWDINEASVDVKAVNTWKSAHSAAVEDVDWSRFNANVFASVGDDSQLLLWDIKSNAEKPIQGVRAHDSDVNCVAFNPYDEYTLVTGGSDNAVKLWDIRKLVQPMHTMEGHEEGVYQVSWSTVKKNLLASSSEDRRVYVWDLNRIGREQSAEDAEDGPPELLYVHGGHTAKVFDFSWHPSEPWYIASVAEDNVLQVWQMVSTILLI